MPKAIESMLIMIVMLIMIGRLGERPDTTADLALLDYYRKEFVHILTNAFTDNVESACHILSSLIRLPLPLISGDSKLEEVGSLAQMLPNSMQPDIEVLRVELILFQHHSQKNRTKIKTIAEAALEFERVVPLTSGCYRLIKTAPITYRRQVNAVSPN